MLYVQKIAELEELNAQLQRDLELLRASEQCLLADSDVKEDLIARLMRSSHQKEDDGTAGRTPGRLSLWGLGSLLVQGRNSKTSAQLEELERLAQESLLDNIRLRKDLRALAEEYRRASIAAEAASQASGAEGP